MCVLRVTSKSKTLARFFASAKLPHYEVHAKGDIQLYGRSKGCPFRSSGFKSAVSEKDWNDLPKQVEDAIRFLRRYRADLLRLRRSYRCDVVLDFPYELLFTLGNRC